MSILTDQITWQLDEAGIMYRHQRAGERAGNHGALQGKVLSTTRAILEALGGEALVRTNERHIRLIDGYLLDVRSGNLLNRVFTPYQSRFSTVLALSTGSDRFILSLGEVVRSHPKLIQEMFWDLPRPRTDRVEFLDRLGALGVRCVVVTPHDPDSPACLVMEPSDENLLQLDAVLRNGGAQLMAPHCNLHAARRSQRFAEPDAAGERLQPLTASIVAFRFAPVVMSDWLVVEIYLGDDREEAYERLTTNADSCSTTKTGTGSVLIADGIQEDRFLASRVAPDRPYFVPFAIS